MRAWVGSIAHETNAFSPVPTTLSSYRHGSVGYQDLLRAAADAGCSLVAGMSARAAPSAPTRRADYEQLRDRFVADILAAGDQELLLLALHGAQVAEGYPDCEGDIVTAIREAVGGQVIIAVLLDLHASISPTLLQQADLVTAIKEYPHTDFPETARQLVDLALRLHRREVRPITAFVPLPLYSLWHTPQLPSKTLVERARELEGRDGVLHISLVHGFPWSDVADAGAAVLVTTDGDELTARMLAGQFARDLWDIRDADLGHYLTLDACLDAAAAAQGNGPVVIADAGDNPGAGTGGDATWLLRALLQRGWHGAAVAMLCDPDSLACAVAAGVGNSVDLQLGGYTGSLSGAPVEGRFEVRSINTAACIDAMPGYAPIPVATLVALRIEGVDIVVSAYREQVFGPRVFEEVGIDPRTCRLLVLKSAQHFYRAFEAMASRILYCDTPCSRTLEFARLPFSGRRFPLWPMEDCAETDIPEPRVFQGR